MDNTKKILSVVFALFSILVGFLTAQIVVLVSSYFQLSTKISGAMAINRIVPIVVAVLTFILLYRISRIREYITEVINEVKKVAWPAKKETWGATVVVIIAVLISGFVLGLFDWLSAALLKLILN